MIRQRLFGLALACAAVWGCWSSQARALEVQPISLTLSEKMPTGMLAISNQSNEAVRFHISAMAWGQKPNGEPELKPTDEVVFFPAMLTLNPQEGRNLRVGIKIKPGGVEKTYRIFVQELPRLMATSDGTGSVGMLTKMAIPLFFQPSAPPKAKLSVASLTLTKAEVKFTIKNTGNVHSKTANVFFRAKNGETVLHTEELDGWYILAGGIRDYAFTLPAAACAGTNSIEVEFKSDHGPVRASSKGVHCSP